MSPASGRTSSGDEERQDARSPTAASAGTPNAVTRSSLIAKNATPRTTSIGAGERTPRYHATTSEAAAATPPKTRATRGE